MFTTPAQHFYINRNAFDLQLEAFWVKKTGKDTDYTDW
jgi:hypothetical protein